MLYDKINQKAVERDKSNSLKRSYNDPRYSGWWKTLDDGITEIYNQALARAMKDAKGFLDALKAFDKKHGGLLDDALKRERQMLVNKLLRENKVIERIGGRMAEAGIQMRVELKTFMTEAVKFERNLTAQYINHMATADFAMIGDKDAAIILERSKNVYDRIAEKYLEGDQRVARALQSEMAAGALKGESTKELAKRISRACNLKLKQAMTIARTERTRVLCAARMDAMEEAQNAGVRMEKEWSTNMDGHARDSHAKLNKQRVGMDEDFVSPVSGVHLKHPGDPNAPADETVRCRCVLIPRVLGPEKTLKKPEKNGIITRGNLAIHHQKFAGYALNPDKDPNKAKAFKLALGYDLNNADELIQNILDHVDETKLVPKDDIGYGMRYRYVLELTGSNGKKANVLTAWIQDGDIKRLISAYVTEKDVTE